MERSFPLHSTVLQSLLQMPWALLIKEVGIGLSLCQFTLTLTPLSSLAPPLSLSLSLPNSCTVFAWTSHNLQLKVDCGSVNW